MGGGGEGGMGHILTHAASVVGVGAAMVAMAIMVAMMAMAMVAMVAMAIMMAMAMVMVAMVSMDIIIIDKHLKLKEKHKITIGRLAPDQRPERHRTSFYIILHSFCLFFLVLGLTDLDT